MAEKKKVHATKAHEMAESHKEISVSEFFAKNRHLLGFDSPRKALLMAVKEAVDNSLDACEEARILPDLYIELKQIKEGRFRVVVEDNGPGIIKEQIPKIFGKLLYGGKFHRLRCSRGQQGIGISAVLLYGQLTTGKGMYITSRVGPKHNSNYYELHIDTKKNDPIVDKEQVVDWNKEHGTRIEVELEGQYQKGKQSVDEYIKEIALINPHANVIYKTPLNETMNFPRGVNELPKEAKEIKPHPYGVELGILMRMLQGTDTTTLSNFLSTEFCRVSPKVASEICEKAKLSPRAKPKMVVRDEAEKLYDSIQSTKIIAPPTDCLSPLGEEALLKGLKKEVDAEFYCVITRPPTVYRGNPFQIEIALAYGGGLEADGAVKIMRFANRVPLLYQQGACSSAEAIIDTIWRNYGLSQSKGNLPQGPVALVVHMVSVWVPFTSEAKEAIAHYPEIVKEMKLALQDAGRKMSSYIRKTVKAREQRERVNLFEKYIPELANSLSVLTGEKPDIIEENLNKVLKKGMKDLLAVAEKAEETKIKGDNVAFGEKQDTLGEFEDGD
ncbi:DNA topoisomerase VI subunit B [Candidatus Woesearchaeota archaeon]|nr:DNA topoisomerase VI subunit B [Candidatus Woesearchaeota archaeon]